MKREGKGSEDERERKGRGKEKERKRKGRGKQEKRKRKGKEETQRKRKGGNGLFVVWGLLFEQRPITKVSLWVSLVLPLAYT
jgi:hypothetical protein